MRLAQAEAARLAKFYADAESELLRAVYRALAKGNKTEYLRAMLENVQAILADLRAGSRDWCMQAVPRIYVNGMSLADDMTGKAATGFGAIHQQAAQVLAENTYNRLADVTQVVGRRASDIYRTLALENVRGSVVGYSTWQQVARGLRQDLTDRGITGFVDRSGHEWNLRRYAETVARTTTRECQVEGTKNRLLELGHDLVVITSHHNPCDLCAPWEGQVVSLTGQTEGYPTLDEAKAAGLFHPNCRHFFGLYDSEAQSDQQAIFTTEANQAATPRGPVKVESYQSLGGGVSDTSIGEINGKKYVFKADEPVARLDMLRGNLEAELLADRLLNHLGIKAPKTDYGEFDIGGGQTKNLLSMEFVEGVMSMRDFEVRHGYDAVNKDMFRRMQVIDVLIGNGDRHKDNFLMRANGDVVPIDHNLAFATDLVIEPGETWQKCFLDKRGGAVDSCQTASHILERSALGRWMLANSKPSDYMTIADDITNRLTDADIDGMIRGLPDALAEKARKEELARVLRWRRDNLLSLVGEEWGIP